jgi:uncharacterized membrane protein YfcA
MEGASPAVAALLVACGVISGVVNTLAGGGSLLSVPLLVVLGLPGTVANGTNRIGVLVQCLAAVWRFRAAGVFEPGAVMRVLLPVVLGSAAGALAISAVADETFERIFGVMMLALLIPTLRTVRTLGAGTGPPRGFSPPVAAVLFFAVGAYGGALQAGVGIPLLFALAHSGQDLVRANAIKVAVIAAVTVTAIPVFVLQDKVAWLPALLLAAGFSVGGAFGARLAVRGGERLIRPVLVAAVLALAGRMLGLY